jgi:hypothetical protein
MGRSPLHTRGVDSSKLENVAIVTRTTVKVILRMPHKLIYQKCTHVQQAHPREVCPLQRIYLYILVSILEVFAFVTCNCEVG